MNNTEEQKQQNGWNEWSRYVLKELERLNNNYEFLSKEMQQMREDIVELKLKAGIWGMMGASVPVVIGLIITFIKYL